MKLRLKFGETTLEKARIFLTNAQRRLDFIHRGNWPAQFLRNAHCGFTEKIYCSAKTSHSSRRYASEALRAGLQTPELWFAGIVECVVNLSF